MKRRWLRHPIIHCIVLGGLLFACREVWHLLSAPSTSKSVRAPLVLSAPQIRQLQADFARRWGAPPTRGQLQALIAETLEDEMLYQEARRLALDMEDQSIRLRLVHKMRAVSADPTLGEAELYRLALALGLDNDVVIRRLLTHKMRLLLQQAPEAAPLSEADLVAYMARHRDRFVRPATVTFSHVFLSGDVHGERLAEQAQAVLAQLRTRALPPEASVELSDPFLLGQQFHSLSYHGIARYFGTRFAAQVIALEPQTWSEPIASPFGLHLVRTHEQVPEYMPPLATVRPQLQYALLEERASERLAQGLLRLRHVYKLRVDMPEDIVASGPTRMEGMP